MNLNTSLASAAALFSATLAVAVLCRKERSVAVWSFSAGMALLALESLMMAASFRDFAADAIDSWQTGILICKAFLPAIWLCFSVTFSRGNYRESLLRSPILLAVFLLVPAALAAWNSGALLDVVPSDELGS